MRRLILLSILALACAAPSWAIYDPTTLYVYGFSLSFNDSTVYFTDIMELDSAWLDSNKKFLYARSSYAYQLKNYLLEQDVLNPTCIICFDEKRTKAEKKYVKMKNKYLKKNNVYTVKFIPITDFQFTPISAADDPSVITSTNKGDLKAARKAEKEEEKEAKAARKAERMRGVRPGPGGQGGRPGGPPPGGMGGGM